MLWWILLAKLNDVISMSDSDLQTYLDSISALPGELNRNLKVVRELDEHIEDILKRNEFDMKKFLQEVRYAKRSSDKSKISSNSQLSELLSTIQLDHESCLKMGSEKIDLVSKLYTLVDHHIQKLDSILSKCESDIQKKEEATPEADIRDYSAGSDFANIVASNAQLPSMIRPAARPEGAPADPAEPRYCICNQVSYGEMVRCDNEDCQYEWFHFQCVGLTQRPKGKWFCPYCRNLKS